LVKLFDVLKQLSFFEGLRTCICHLDIFINVWRNQFIHSLVHTSIDNQSAPSPITIYRTSMAS